MRVRVVAKHFGVVVVLSVSILQSIVQPVMATPPPRVSLSPSPVTITEGSTTPLTITLNEPIIAPDPAYFDLSITSSDPDRLLVQMPVVSYSDSDWYLHKAFSISAVDDGLVNGDTSVTLSYSVSSNSEYYNGFTGSVSVTVKDNDVAPVITSPTADQSLPAGSLTVTGTAVDGQELEVLVDGASVGTTTADGSGDWSLLIPKVIAGHHSVKAQALTNHHYGFMANDYTGSIDVVDVDTHSYVHEITDEHSVGVTFNSHNNTVYSAASWNDTCAVRAINPITYHVVQSVGMGDTGAYPIGLTLNPSGTRAYLLCQQAADDYFVMVVDTDNNLPIDSFVVPFEGTSLAPSGIAVSHNGSQLWIRTINGIQTFRLSDHTHLDTISFADAGTAYNQNIIFNSEGTKAYTANSGIGSLYVIDTSDNSVSPGLSLGQGANMVALSPDGSKLFAIASYPTSAVFVVNTANNTLAQTVPVDTSYPPESLAISEDGKWLIGDDHGSGGIFFGTVAGGGTITDTIFSPSGGSYYTNTGGFVSTALTRVLGESTSVSFGATTFKVPNTGLGSL